MRIALPYLKSNISSGDELNRLKKDKALYEKEWEKLKEEINSGIINAQKIGSIMHSLNCADYRILELEMQKNPIKDTGPKIEAEILYQQLQGELWIKNTKNS